MSNQPKKILILMATCNGENFIAEQLDSILNQKGVDLDLVIADDRSTDATVTILNNYLKKNPNINLVNNKERAGPAFNFYNLIRSANLSAYDFIALSDQDDVWPEHRLQRAIECLILAGSDGYSSDVLAFNENKGISLIKKSSKQTKLDYFFETPGPGCSFVFTQKLALYLQNFLRQQNPAFVYHDWLIYALARHHHFNWHIDDAPNLFYRQHQSNFMGANVGFYAAMKRVNRILFGEYYRELITLYKILNPESPTLDFKKVMYFLINAFKTRRRILHCLLMIPFLLILSIQKNY